MTPRELTAASFGSYPNKGREMAVESLELLHELPLGFTPFILKEIISADVKFPAEFKELEDQLAYLKGMPAAERASEMKPFAELKLDDTLAAFDWVNRPGQFLEQLSAHLWATHQMDGFRSASESYVRKFHASITPARIPVARAGVMVIGKGVGENSYSLFVKLQREGTVFNQVKPENGLAIIHAALEERARNYPAAYSHWCIDGAESPLLKGFSNVSYAQLAPVRSALSAKMLTAYQAQHFDPEMLRTNLARTTFESLGIKPTGDGPLDNFSLTLLTEGSGTQIYSTTFVQWAAREALRRAQPVTLYAHFTPRQRARGMDELLAGAKSPTAPEGDPAGSLIDADMGAYYTWLNQQRLPGAEQSRFLVWFEGHRDAVLISPSQKRAVLHSAPIEMTELMQKVLS